MKYATARPYADPEKAARRILEIANAVEPIQGRIHIEKINEPFLFRDRGSPAEHGAGLKLAIERGWLVMHEFGTFVPSRRRAPSCSRDLWTKMSDPEINDKVGTLTLIAVCVAQYFALRLTLRYYFPPDTRSFFSTPGH
jgi:hypothetical protein